MVEPLGETVRLQRGKPRVEYKVARSLHGPAKLLADSVYSRY